MGATTRPPPGYPRSPAHRWRRRRNESGEPVSVLILTSDQHGRLDAPGGALPSSVPAAWIGVVDFRTRPLTPETWADLEALLELPGGSIVRGCWCMYYRRTGTVVVNAEAGRTNRQQLCDLVDDGVVPGLVGYLDGRPAGWISLGPREDYLKLKRSPIMKPVDDEPVWSVVCTYVAREFRGRGLQHRLLAGALDFARDHGVRLVEAYPVDKPERSHDDFMFFGSRSLYERAGFHEVVRRSPTRVVMRRRLRPRRGRG